MFASLKNVVPNKNGKGGLASAGSLFPFNQAPAGVTLAEILAARPQFASQILTALLVAAMCDSSPTPHRLCACGCGAFVSGKAISASPACRKRQERQRRAIASGGGKQFNLVWQDEISLAPAKPKLSGKYFIFRSGLNAVFFGGFDTGGGAFAEFFVEIGGKTRWHTVTFTKFSNFFTTGRARWLEEKRGVLG